MEQTGHDEMRHVVWLLKEAAIKTLPQVRGKKTSSNYKDATLRGSIWVIGGAETFLPHIPWRRISRKPGEPSSTLEASRLFREILALSHQDRYGSRNLCSYGAFIWLRELDFDREDAWAATCRGLFWGVGKEGSKMGKTPLQYNCSYCPRNGGASIQEAHIYISHKCRYQQSKLIPYWESSAQLGSTYYLQKVLHDVFSPVDHRDGQQHITLFDESKNTDHTISIIQSYTVYQQGHCTSSQIWRFFFFLDNAANTNKNVICLAGEWNRSIEGHFSHFSQVKSHSQKLKPRKFRSPRAKWTKHV